MAKTKEQKKAMLGAIGQKLKDANSVVFAGFDKLSVAENNRLRNRLKEEKSEFLVAKKTLLKIALEKQEQKGISFSEYKGQIAAIFGYGDEIVPAKIVKEFKKEHEDKIHFLGGILENKYIGKEQVDRLADLPGKDELRARLVGALNAPISGLANVLAGNLRSLLYALNAIKEKKQA